MRGLMIALAAVIAVGACSILNIETDEEYNAKYRNSAYAYCKEQWEASGYKWRIVGESVRQPYVPSFRCQVQVGGHWFPEDAVKVGKQ